MKQRLVQFLAGLTPGDAITQEALMFKKIFPRSLIVAEHIAKGVPVKALSFHQYRMRKNDILLYHHSIFTPLTQHVIDLPCKKIMIYHNITPSHFFAPYNSMIAGRLSHGRDSLRRLTNRFDFVFADSSFNAVELLSMGFSNVQVIPVLTPESDHLDHPEQDKVKHHKEGCSILFVGRIVPNKNHADLFKIFSWIKKIDASARLTLAGSYFPGMELYQKELESLASALNIQDNLNITGYLERHELLQCYANATLFLCTSLHEGFCVPLIEAMRAGLPVLYYQSEESAVKETMGGAGVGFTTMDHLRVAESALLLHKNIKLRETIIREQYKRLTHFSTEKSVVPLMSALRKLSDAEHYT